MLSALLTVLIVAMSTSAAGDNRTNGPVLINIGLPKTGSSSLHAFAQCMGLRSLHWEEGVGRTDRDDDVPVGVHRTHHLLAGYAVQECARSGKPLLSCFKYGEYDVYAQLDCEATKEGDQDACWMPQISHLEGLVVDYPDATFILTSRDIKKWVHSVVSWGRMDERISQCTLPEVDLPYTASAVPPNSTAALADDQWVAMLEHFYESVHARARNIMERAHVRQGVHWFEVDIESPDAGRVVAENVAMRHNIRASADDLEGCWGHANAGAKGLSLDKPARLFTGPDGVFVEDGEDRGEAPVQRQWLRNVDVSWEVYEYESFVAGTLAGLAASFLVYCACGRSEPRRRASLVATQRSTK